MPTADELAILRALPLEVKIQKSKQRIREWLEREDSYVAFSGGKDSTNILDRKPESRCGSKEKSCSRCHFHLEHTLNIFRMELCQLIYVPDVSAGICVTRK